MLGTGSSTFIPPEVWDEVILHLPQTAQRTCLWVSRTFHASAMRMLFSRVFLEFGCWELWEIAVSPDSEKEASYELLGEERSRRSLEILGRVADDAPFASAIRGLEIRAFISFEDSDMYEHARLSLVAGVRCLSNLTSFTWHGDWPSPHPRFLEVLAISCTLLRDVALPKGSLAALPIDHLQNVHSISYTWPSDEEASSEHSLTAKSCKMVYSELRRFSVPFAHPDEIPVYHLPNLTHLELTGVQSFDRFDVLLCRLHQLQSLSILGPYENDLRLFEILSTLPSALPRLRSLAIQGPHPHFMDVLTAEHIRLLSDFLRDRSSLRCLYSTFEIQTQDIDMYLEMISTLKNLEVFDLRMQAKDLTSDFVVHLLPYLPVTLSAMRITTGGKVQDSQVFASFWEYFCCIGFLFIRTWDPNAMRVSLEDVVRGSKTLKLIGYNGRFHEVACGAGEATISSPWSPRRVRFRTVEDFGCEDWEWLLRNLRVLTAL